VDQCLLFLLFTSLLMLKFTSLNRPLFLGQVGLQTQTGVEGICSTELLLYTLKENCYAHIPFCGIVTLTNLLQHGLY
jgi:hypothetical protein